MRALRWLAVATTVGMLLVLVMGAAVTNTGSAQGCGRSWPLCNGRFVPEFTVVTAIEYSHRAVSGVEGLLVVGLAAAMLARWRREREVQVLVPLMVGALVLQAGLGAWAVMAPQSAAVLASHFGISLVAFAATFLAAACVVQHGRDQVPPTDWPRRTAGSLPDPGVRMGSPSAPRGDSGPVPNGFRWATLGCTAYVLGVVYLGAYVRHAGVSLGCADWPLCNGQVWPGFDGPAGVVFAHRLAALGAIVLLAGLAGWARRVEVASTAAVAALVLVVLQALSGASVVLTQLGLFSTLAHAGIMALLFAALASMVRRVVVAGGVASVPQGRIQRVPQGVAE